ENSVLIIEVPFEFHKDRIESVKSRESIMSVMREVYGNVMKIECSVNGNIKRKKEVSADIILKRAPVEDRPAVIKKDEPAKRVYTPKPYPRIDEIFADMYPLFPFLDKAVKIELYKMI